MNKAKPYLFKLLRDPRASAFGLSVFCFSAVCWRAPEWDLYKLVFLSGALLAASFLTLFESARTNFAAAVLGGYLPMELAYTFWTTPHMAEVPYFSLRHLTYFAGSLFDADRPVILFLALSVFVLACAARTLRRLAAG